MLFKTKEALEQVTVQFPQPSTREQRLRRWAQLCREYGRSLALYNNLEYCNPNSLKTIMVKQNGSAMALAAADPGFQSEGLPEDASVADIMSFFELTMNELHKFSCDCGGSLSNTEQAHRIDKIAARR